MSPEAWQLKQWKASSLDPLTNPLDGFLSAWSGCMQQKNSVVTFFTICTTLSIRYCLRYGLHELINSFKFVVREVFDKWNTRYFYETYLKFDFQKEDQKFDSNLYNVTVLTKRITENGYSESPILNEQLTLENLMELYQHCFKKNVHELCFMRFPKIMNDCFDAGKDQIKEQTQNFFSNVLGIRGGGW